MEISIQSLANLPCEAIQLVRVKVDAVSMLALDFRMRLPNRKQEKNRSNTHKKQTDSPVQSAALSFKPLQSLL
ncbi:hypothetical protein [Acidithiobacillus sp. IBUN Pt1247-S3]|uniref:hypothetical protein n=1 Tax=Acidithiobacillus sp. IBUN Pt1247-S3 TaxID=3166642 RepID=UPI0034E3E687